MEERITRAFEKVRELRKLMNEDEQIAIRFTADIEGDIKRGYSCWQGTQEIHHYGLSCYEIYRPDDVVTAMNAGGCGFGQKTEGSVRVLGEIEPGCYLIAAEDLWPEG